MTDRPRLAALAVVLRDANVLLVRRRNPPDAGFWGFPGGHVEWGETVYAAAARELREETSVLAVPRAYLDNLDVIIRAENGSVAYHFLLVAVLCTYQDGVPRAASDAAEAEWVPVARVLEHALPLSADVDRMLKLALVSL